MRRKLVKQGPSTLTLSIPKDWIDRFNLKNGDEVDLEEVETKLIISSSKKSGVIRTLDYDFKDISEHLVRAIILGIYKSGLKDVKIININSKQLIKIQEMVRNSPGLEIIDSTKNSLRIIDIGTAEKDTLTKSENQIYWKIINVIDKIIENKSSKEEIYSFDMEINRLSFFIERNLASRFSANAKTFLEYEKVAILERLGDSLRSYNKYSKKKADELKILQEISGLIESIRTFESNRDMILLQKVRDNLEIIKNKTKVSEKKPELSNVLIRAVVGNLGDLYETLVAENILAFSLDNN